MAFVVVSSGRNLKSLGILEEVLTNCLKELYVFENQHLCYYLAQVGMKRPFREHQMITWLNVPCALSPIRPKTVAGESSNNPS